MLPRHPGSGGEYPAAGGAYDGIERPFDQEGFSQAQAAKVFGVTQPRISDLTRGKIHLFSLDTLVNMVASAELHVELKVSDAA